MTNLLADGPDPDGSRRIGVYYLRVEPGAGAGTITTSGRIEQVVARDGERWRVHRHVVISDF